MSSTVVSTRAPPEYNVVIDGPTRAGKTWMVNQMLPPKYRRSTDCPIYSTYGVEIHPVRDGDKVYIMHDLAGMDLFRGKCDIYYKKADLAIFVMDFYNLELVDHFTRKLKDKAPPGCPYLVIFRSEEMSEYVSQPAIFLPRDGNIDGVLARINSILSGSN